MLTEPVQESSMLSIDPTLFKIEVGASCGPLRKRKGVTPPPTEDGLEDSDSELKPLDRAPMSRAREIRLEQNRKAARESRKRKKVMVEELQRSVIFFSRANAVLQHKNEELNRMFMQAQQAVAHQQKSQAVSHQESLVTKELSQKPLIISSLQVAAPIQGQVQENQCQPNTIVASTNNSVTQEQKELQPQSTGSQSQSPQPQVAQAQANAQAVATQALFESQGFPTAAARAAAQTFGHALAPENSAAQPSPSATINTNAVNYQAAASNLQAAASAAANLQAASNMSIQMPFPGMGYPGLPNPYSESLQAAAIAAAAAQGQHLNPNAFVGYHPLLAQSFQAPRGVAFPIAAATEGQQKAQQQFVV